MIAVIFTIAFGLLCGLTLLYVFARAILWMSDREDYHAELESEYSMRQLGRNSQMIGLLWKIKSGNTGLWDEYHRLDAEDARLTRQERKHLIENDPSVLSDEAYQMIYGGK